MQPFPESLLVFITTQSDERPVGVFKSELAYARAVRDGKITEGVVMLPVLYEFPAAVQTDKAKPWAHPALWSMVLPNLGRSCHLDRLVAEWRQALDKGEAEARRWASQHLNIEIGIALHADRWAGALHWEAAERADAPRSLAELIERSEVCTVGIDGGGLDDLLGLAVLGRCADTRAWLLWGRAWAQSEVYERRQDIASSLDDFAAAGDLVRVPDDDPQRDLREVAEICAELRNAGKLPEKAGIGVDRFGIAAAVDVMIEAGITDEQIVSIPQGYQLQSAIMGIERKAKDGSLVHAGQGLMAWTVSNAKTVQKGSAIMITKSEAGRAKIDPLIAMFNAAMLMAGNPQPARVRSPWEDPDFRMAAE